MQENLPNLYNLFWQAYSKPSHLFYRGKTLSSETGLQQGDPGGPALFSLGLDHIVKSLKSEINLWYLDDSNLADCPQVVLGDLLHIKRELNKIGLSINNSKSELICLNLEDPSQTIENFREILPDIKITSVEDTIVLGSPITSHGIRKEIKSKLEALTQMVSKLELIDPHQAFV